MSEEDGAPDEADSGPLCCGSTVNVRSHVDAVDRGGAPCMAVASKPMARVLLARANAVLRAG